MGISADCQAPLSVWHARQYSTRQASRLAGRQSFQAVVSVVCLAGTSGGWQAGVSVVVLVVGWVGVQAVVQPGVSISVLVEVKVDDCVE